jgi:hypothetical protein
MQQKQVESLRDIQSKLNEMNQVKDILKATNKFKPNLSSLNQNASSLFGLIKLSEYCSNPNPFKSEILTDLEQYFDKKITLELTKQANTYDERLSHWAAKLKADANWQ